MRNQISRWTRRIVGVCVAVTVGGVTSCSVTEPTEVPRCGSIERVALIAQSVPSTSYVPCIKTLQPGWSSTGLNVHSGHTRFTLASDRSPDHPVRVQLSAACTIGVATPIPPRTLGGRTYLQLSSIDPRYAGTMSDIFPGGCVTYQFDFERRLHIELMAQLSSTVGFIPRQQLRLDLQHRLGVRLDP